MLGLHAFVSVNVHRYNIILMPMYGDWRAAGFVLRVWEWVRGRYQPTIVRSCMNPGVLLTHSLAVFNIVVIFVALRKNRSRRRH